MQDMRRSFFPQFIEIQGGGGTPYNSLYEEAPFERDTFFRLQVYKRLGISQVEVYKRVGRSVIEVFKWAFNRKKVE